MTDGKKLGEQIILIVDNQLKGDKPVETKQTLVRLMRLGYIDFDAKQLIGKCVVCELIDVIKSGNPFDENRYVKNLHRLPEEPFSMYEKK